ncbi:MAG: prepilin-type N-terminal cleavage/methylation domain-containing protein [Deltaproteobacteria bacterium]|nr:prepilin-type N-terminal cleavage/methylation domain-containing protein [Deltaproteobacteria bacterium]
MNITHKRNIKHCSQEGFTLIEVLISMFLLAFGIISLVALSTATIKSTNAAKKLSQASNVATEKLEALEGVSFKLIMLSGSDSDISRACTANEAVVPPYYDCIPTNGQDKVTLSGGTVITWDYRVTYLDLDNDNNYFTTIEGAEIRPFIDTSDSKLITVTVYWTDLFGDHEFKLTSIRSIVF